MRTLLGIAILGIGLFGLAFWGARDHAVRMEAEVRGDARLVIADAIHPMAVEVSGRDITLTGTADSDNELAGFLTGLDALRGRRVVRWDGVDVLPLIDPYDTALAKGSDGSLAITGYAPNAIAAESAEARGATGAMTLPLGSGAPDGWDRAMAAGAQALSHLVEGSVALTGNTLVLSGKAATPDDSKAAAVALATSPEGFDRVMAIDVLDPGVVVFDLGYEAGEGLWIFGTVPQDFDATDMAAALGISAIAGEPHATIGQFEGLEARLSALRPLLPDLDRLTMRAEEGRLFVSAEALPGLDATLLASRLRGALGPDAGIDVTDGVPPEDGLLRINAATGREEASAAGYWLRTYQFEVSRAACNDEAARLQAGRSIRFVTGSAELDTQSMAIINDVAGLVRHCTSKAGMSVFIGGHTDSQGDDNANYRLSVERAKAVRDALAARGVPMGKMQAVGYGETEPVADNETEAGRAANRRTTFTWPN